MRKSFVIAIVMILALSVMGFGFAKWSDTVSINTTVNTGTLIAGIADLGVLDAGADPQQSPGVNAEGKDIALTVSTNNDPLKFVIGNQGFFGSITETLTNVYPWYKTGATIAIGNGGTVPFKVETLAIGAWTDVDLSSWMVVGGWSITNPDGTSTSGIGLADLNAALAGQQVDKGGYMTVKYEYYFAETNTFGALLPQNASGSFTETIQCSQWNEVQ